MRKSQTAEPFERKNPSFRDRNLPVSEEELFVEPVPGNLPNIIANLPLCN